MALKMVFLLVFVIISAIGCNAAGELSILSSPDSLKFSGSDKALESSLKDIFSASLGLTVQENSDWNGLTIVDPFYTPEAVVEVYIDGIPNLGKNAGLKSKNFPLVADEYEPDTFDAIKHRISQRFTNGHSKIVNIDLQELPYSSVFGEITPPKVTKQTLQHLKYSVEEDYKFLSELAALKAIIAKVESGIITPDNVVDFYYFRFRSLHALCDFHGPNSLQAKEAKQLLGSALEQLSLSFSRAYGGAALVVAACSDVAHTRRAARTARAAPGPAPRAHLLQEETAYSEDYAAIFNILLWFSIVFVFTLVAIVYVFIDMDPGRDSIIYRMTSTRIKKDN